MRLYISILLLLATTLSYTQQVKEYKFSHFSLSDGLISNTINDIIQDKQKFIWLATPNGLQRFDGIRFETVFKASSYFNIHSLLSDEQNKLWFICSNNKIVRVDSKTLQSHEYHTKFSIGSSSKLLKTSLGVLLLESNKGQIFQFANEDFRPLNKVNDALGSLKIYEAAYDQQKNMLYLSLGFDGIGIYDLKTSRLYIHNESPFFQINKRPGYKGTFLPGQGYDLAIDRGISGYTQNLLYLKNNESTIKRFHLSDLLKRAFEIYGFLPDIKGNLWIYGSSLLMKWNKVGENSFTKIAATNQEGTPLFFDDVLSSIQDIEGNIWLATTNGLFSFNPEQDFFHDKILSNNPKPKSQENIGSDINITCLLQLSNNDKLAGTWGNGLFLLDSLLNMKPLPPGLKNIVAPAAIRDMYLDPFSKNILLDLSQGKLGVYNEKSDRLSIYKPDIFNGVNIRQIKGDKEGNIWFGLGDGRLIKHYRSAGNNFNIGNKQILKSDNESIKKLSLDSNNNIWVVTNPIYKVNASTEEYSKELDARFQNNNIGFVDALEYNDSTMLIAGGTLNILNTKSHKVHQLNITNGLKDNTVISLFKDKHGKIWAGMGIGLSRIDLETRTVSYYDINDGLRYNFFHPGNIQRFGNNIYLGTSQGAIVYFNPDAFIQKAIPPSPIITSILLSKQSICVDSIYKKGILELKNDNTALEINFSALTFSRAFKYYYSYMLEGVDNKWIRSDDGTAFYHSIEPGAYKFKIKTFDINGSSSAVTVPFEIKIKKPFWKTAGFYVALLLLLIILIVIYSRIKYQRLLMMEQIRSRISRDLHDDIGSTLTTISILSEIAKTSRNNLEHLNKIGSYSSQLISTMNDIVWSINPNNDSITRIAARMREYLSTTFDNKQVNYKFNIEENVHSIHLDMEARRNFYLIFKETVNNCVKYAQCKNIFIYITLREGKLHLSIKDDGVGFNPHDSKVKGNGLLNMETRANAINGKFIVISSPGMGTETHFEISY